MGEEKLKCVTCGFDCVHPVAVKVEPVTGNTVVYINADGVISEPSNAAERTRGIEIITTFICEAGHQWDEKRAFCKGETHQSIELAPRRIDVESRPPAIWRD